MLEHQKIFNDFIKNNKNVKMTPNGLVFKTKTGFKPLTWENAKEDSKILDVFNPFRKKIVDKILEEIIDKLNCKPECTVTAAGSISLDSDYDITMDGKNSSQFIDNFNDIFISLFKEKANIVFDTNIYGTSFFHSSIATNYDFAIRNKELPCSPRNFIFYINTNSNKDDVLNQHTWAFIKLFMYINKIKNTVTKKSILDLINKNKSYRNVKNRSTRKLDQLKRLKTTYEKELRKYNNIKNDFESYKIKNIPKAVALKEQASKTNFFGVETYFTQGAINHVVGQLQLKFTSLTITQHEYIDSLIENLGDIIKEYNHYPDDTRLFVTHSSKYIIRVFSAISRINTSSNVSYTINSAKKLRKLRGSDNDNIIDREIDNFKTSINCNNVTTSLNILLCIISFSLNVIDKHFAKCEYSRASARGRSGQESFLCPKTVIN